MEAGDDVVGGVNLGSGVGCSKPKIEEEIKTEVEKLSAMFYEAKRKNGSGDPALMIPVLRKFMEIRANCIESGLLEKMQHVPVFKDIMEEQERKIEALKLRGNFSTQENLDRQFPKQRDAPQVVNWAEMALDFYNEKKNVKYELLDIEDGYIRSGALRKFVTLNFVGKPLDECVQELFHAELFVPPDVCQLEPISVIDCYIIKQLDANGCPVPPTPCCPRSKELGIPPPVLVISGLPGCLHIKKRTDANDNEANNDGGGMFGSDAGNNGGGMFGSDAGNKLQEVET